MTTFTWFVIVIVLVALIVFLWWMFVRAPKNGGPHL